MTEPALTLAELERLLDVHGTQTARWPAPMWEAASRLLASSPEARALWDESAALDRLLDELPPTTPSPALNERVLAAAPRPRRSARWRTLVPLAAAAGIALWLASGTTTVQTPTAVNLTSVQLGEYTSPTDYLLDSSGVDVADSVPAFGCDDSTLGCPTFDSEAATATRETT